MTKANKCHVKPYVVVLNDDVYCDQFDSLPEAKKHAEKRAQEEGKTYAVYKRLCYFERSIVQEHRAEVS